MVWGGEGTSGSEGADLFMQSWACDRWAVSQSCVEGSRMNKLISPRDSAIRFLRLWLRMVSASRESPSILLVTWAQKDPPRAQEQVRLRSRDSTVLAAAPRLIERRRRSSIRGSNRPPANTCSLS